MLFPDLPENLDEFMNSFGKSKEKHSNLIQRKQSIITSIDPKKFVPITYHQNKNT
jgi:hypothetical protein